MVARQSHTGVTSAQISTRSVPTLLFVFVFVLLRLFFLFLHGELAVAHVHTESNIPIDRLVPSSSAFLQLQASI